MMIADPGRLMARKILLAKLALFWERVWSALFLPLMVTGLAALFVFSGVAPLLADWLRLAMLAGLGLGFAVSLRDLLRVSWPGRDEALRRIETRSGLKHRPVTALHDKLADPGAGPVSRALWLAHRQRLAAHLKSLKAGLPHSLLRFRDPYALRNMLAIALIAVLTLSGVAWRDRISEAASGVAMTARVPASVDAWVSPPSYTRKAPLLLPAGVPGDGAGVEEFYVPENSILVVRLNGAIEPGLKLIKPETDGTAPGDQVAAPVLEPGGREGVFEARAELKRPVDIVVENGGRELARWRVALIPDNPPAVEISDTLDITPVGGFAIPWKASDDYGVAAINGIVALADAAAGAGTTASQPLKFDAPSFAVALPKLNPTEAEGRTFQDLTEHPWAGSMVTLTLEAADQAGQTGTSQPVTFKLPEREFRQVMAQVMIEQRRKLVNMPDKRLGIVRALSALLSWPDGLVDKSGPFLAVREVIAKLYRAGKREELKALVGEMWQVALLIEEGDLNDALKELEALRKELQQALAEGAPPEKIAEIMDKLRQALDRYLEAMRQQMQEAMRNGQLQQNQQPVDPDQMINQQDLQKMLDAIENLAKSGARDAAQEMLAQLENILKNLQPGMANQMQQQGNSPLGKMLQELGDMMRRQQELMDQTFRMPDNGQQGGMQPDPNAQDPGSRGNDPTQGSDLAGQQGQLQRMLEEMMRRLGEQGMNSPQGLDRAGRAMEGAEGALRGEQRDEALGKQGEALEGLREGAQSMAEQMMQQGNGQANNQGRHGEARGDNNDPLGRPMPQRGEDQGPERNMVPDEAAIEKARRILEALRNRANQPQRPRIELDYLDRLLRGLY